MVETRLGLNLALYSKLVDGLVFFFFSQEEDSRIRILIMEFGLLGTSLWLL